jgi:hypothetical protein
VEPVADLAGVPAAGSGGAQRAEFLLRDPRRQDLSGRVVVDAAVPHPRQRPLGEVFPAAEQQPPVGPGGIGLAAATIEQVAGDPLAHRGHGLVREQDQMEVVHRDLRVGQGRANGGGVAGMRVDHHHLHPGPELGRAGGQPGLDRGAAPPVDLPQQGLVTGDVDEPGLSHGSGRRHRLRLGQLDRAMDRHRSLHRRPRHPVPRGDLGLVPPVLHRHRQCGPQPRRGPHPGRHLGDLLGERRTWTDLGAATPLALAPLHRDRPAAAGQVVRAGQHPVLARGRAHPAARAARRIGIVGDQLHDPNTEPGERDTLHRQALESQQTRRIISTVDPGPWLSLRCSRTQRGSRSHGPPTFRRAARSNLGLPGQDRRARSKSQVCTRRGRK